MNFKITLHRETFLNTLQHTIRRNVNRQIYKKEDEIHSAKGSSIEKKRLFGGYKKVPKYSTIYLKTLERELQALEQQRDELDKYVEVVRYFYSEYLETSYQDLVDMVSSENIICVFDQQLQYMPKQETFMRLEDEGEGEIKAKKLTVEEDPAQGEEVEFIQITESAYELWIGCVKAGGTILGLADWYEENKETLE